MQPELPSVPGVILSGVLGSGATSTVYAGTDTATGHRVAVKVIAPEHDQTRSRATGFAASSDALVRLFRVGQVGTGGQSCLVMEFCPGGSLAEQVAARGRLDFGEVVCVLRGVAEALTALHARDLVNGDVSASNVLFTALGRPLLGDLEAIGRVGEPAVDASDGFCDDSSTTLQPATDVYSLGALGWFMLTGETPGPSSSRVPLTALRPETPRELADLVVSCLCPPPRRPPLVQVITGLESLPVQPEPVQLLPVDRAADVARIITARRRPAAPVVAASERVRAAAQRQREADGRRASRRRQTKVAVAVVAATGLAVGARMVLQPGPSVAQPVPATPTASAAPVSDPAEALTELNRRRTVATMAGDPAQLTTVDAPGSPALRHDQQLIKSFQDKGIRPENLKISILWTTVRETTSTRSTVLLSSVVQPYRQVARSNGQLIADVKRGPIVTNLVTLTKVNAEWRVYSVTKPG